MLLFRHHIAKRLPFHPLSYSSLPPSPPPFPDDHGPLLSSSCQRFSLRQLEEATQNWSVTHILGSGGFGTVYKGALPGDQKTLLAIKRAKATNSNFQKEVSAHLTRSLAHSLTHSLAHSPAHSLAYSLTHSLARLLTRSFRLWSFPGSLHRCEARPLAPSLSLQCFHTRVMARPPRLMGTKARCQLCIFLGSERPMGIAQTFAMLPA